MPPLELNLKNKNGFTALMRACYCGNVAIAAELLRGKADPLLADNNGYTALHLCVRNGFIGCVESS